MHYTSNIYDLYTLKGLF